MKRGQVGLGLVIFAIVAIIAVIGLVLLFSRASAQGAAIGTTYGGAPGITSYGDKAIASYYPPSMGIAQTYPTPEYNVPAYGVPQISYPSYGMDQMTKGSRTPVFIVRKADGGERAGYAGLEDVYACNQDLNVGSKFGNVQDYFSCYVVPFKGGSDAKGFFPPDSSAEPRPWLGRQGGDVYCYGRSTGAEQQVSDSEDRMRNTILTTLVDNPSGVSKYQWTEVQMNNKRVPVCWVSSKTFPFYQGNKV